MEIEISKYQNHQELNALFEKCINSDSISLDLMIKNKDLVPGAFISILQFLNSLDRCGLTNKISLININLNELKKSLSEYSLIYAWVLFVNNRDKNYFPALYELSTKYHEIIESILHFKRNDVEEMKKKGMNPQRVDPQFLTIHALGKEKRKDQKKLSREQEQYYQKIFSNRTQSKKEGSTHFFHGCFDHIMGLGASGFMYSDPINKTIKPKKAIREFFSNIFNFYFLFNDHTGHNRRVMKSHTIYDHLSVIFHELVHNTHVWAMYKSSQKISNIRGAYMSIQGIKEWEDNPKDLILGQFIKDLKSHYRKQETLFEDNENANPILIIELSIIDAGEGYPEVFLKKPLSEITITEEIKAINDCFNRNMTSDTENIASLKGIGLAEVTKMLSRGNGLITIRTGRSFGFRSFVSKPIDAKEELQKKSFWLDIESNLFPVSGTSVSIFYPIVLN